MDLLSNSSVSRKEPAQKGLTRASQTAKNIKSLYMKDQSA
ncbi:dodecin domain-containing protein [Flavobacterium sp. W22_SRS_FP1]